MYCHSISTLYTVKIRHSSKDDQPHNCLHQALLRESQDELGMNMLKIRRLLRLSITNAKERDKM